LVTLGAASLRSGSTTIQNGTVQLNNNTALGSGSISLSNSAILELGGVTVGQALSLGNTTMLRATNAASHFSGAITAVASASNLSLSSGGSAALALTIDNYTGGSGSTTHITGSGAVVLTSSNSYS